MICVRDLDFTYGGGDFRLAIDRIDIADRERVAVVGPSGSGKTTLLNLLAGIALPDTGKISVADHDLTNMSDAARRVFRVTKIGLVFQQFELIEYLDVLDNILLPYRINRALRLTSEVRSQAREIADRVGIADKLRRFPDRLSHGERQRVAICRAVLPRPRVILADEPTGNLDAANKDRVMDLLFAVAADCEATLLTVTHDSSLLSRFDRTIDLSLLPLQENPVSP